jgi:uncharacterized protein YjbI with pentapeptide repeats
MYGAFLVKADFRDADLRDAMLWFANLQKANFEYADLGGAYLMETKLQQANLGSSLLSQAQYLEQFLEIKQDDLVKLDLQALYLSKKTNLQQANLIRANLQQANLLNANLHKANLLNADLEQASLMYADLREAKNLTIEQLSKVKTLYKAKVDPALLEQVNKCCPHLLEKPSDFRDIEIKKGKNGKSKSLIMDRIIPIE